MLVNELKCVEVLLRTLTNNQPLSTQIHSVFESERDYKKHKNNLFNLISIKKLITYYHENLPFSLKTFLETGTIPELFPEKCPCPIIYESSSSEIEDIYRNIVDALSNDHYIFDNENNLYISSDYIEAFVPEIWLYRLSEGAKKTFFEKTYLYNKGTPKQITNKEELLNYLRRTKSFIVRLSSSNPNANYKKEFAKARKTVNNFLRGQREVRVENIIDLLERTLPKSYHMETHRIKLDNSFWIISRAEKMGEAFYGESIFNQESIINDWLIEYFNSSELANLEAQKIILQADPAVNLNLRDNININSAISGLFSLYMNIIASESINLDTISLSAFRIKKYVPESKQILRSTRNAFTTAIATKEETAENYRRQLNELYDEIGNLDIIKDFDLIAKKTEEINQLSEEYRRITASSTRLNSKREEINTYEDSLPSNSVESLAFDNEKIIELINRATIKGSIYISGKDLIIEDYNPEFAEPVFKVAININRLIDLIESINFALEESFTDGYNEITEQSYKKAS